MDRGFMGIESMGIGFLGRPIEVIGFRGQGFGVTEVPYLLKELLFVGPGVGEGWGFWA
jgi:hypothetical protein